MMEHEQGYPENRRHLVFKTENFTFGLLPYLLVDTLPYVTRIGSGCCLAVPDLQQL